jgi:hypothetical protein
MSSGHLMQRAEGEIGREIVQTVVRPYIRDKN